MRYSRLKAAFVLLAAVFTLTGCGEALYELTPEEEAAIVGYSALAVAKYNNFQTDGAVYVEPGSASFKDGSNQPATEEQASETEGQMMPEASDAAGGSGADTGNNTGNNEAEPASEEPSQSINEILNLGAAEIEYIGNSLCQVYDQSDAYAVDADPGMQFLVLNMKLKNPSGEDQNIDMISKKPSFKAVVNGTETVMAQMTILPNDISTYQGTLPAGAEQDAVLLFQIPQEIKEIQDVQLKVTVEGANP